MLQSVVNGLSLTGIYVLSAVGFNVLFGILKVANFSHGAFIALGAYIALFLVVDLGVSYAMAILVAIAFGAIGGLVLERGLLRFTPTLELELLGTLAVGMLIEDALLLTVGGATRTIPTQISGAIEVGNLRIANQSAVVILVSFAVIVLVSLVLYRTLPGRMARAVAEDPTGAESIGIDVGIVRVVVAMLALSLATMAGALMAPSTALGPFMGTSLLLKAFVICIIGGLGSFPGAVVAGAGLGISEALIAASLGAVWSQVFGFALVIVVLIVWPGGLFGASGRTVSAHA